MSQDFTISNGQIFTPGFAVLNAPQPETPLGGGKLLTHPKETLHISLDVTANGKLPLLDSSAENDSPSQIFNITVFLYSYDTGKNFTVSNGTAGEDDSSLGPIMEQEPGSTVKHINWIWPDCLVGDGQPEDEASDRGNYNISIRQNFRLNDEDHYTIIDVPISVTNSIEEDEDRPPCNALTNELLSPEEIDAESANAVGVLFAPDDATEVDFDQPDEGDTGDGGQNDDDGNQNDGGNGNQNDDGDETDGEDDGDGDKGDSDGKDSNGGNGGFSGTRPEAGPEDGLGSASMLSFSWSALLVGVLLATRV